MGTGMPEMEVILRKLGDLLQEDEIWVIGEYWRVTNGRAFRVKTMRYLINLN